MKSATSFSAVFESAATRGSANKELASTDRALARLQPTVEAARRRFISHRTPHVYSAAETATVKRKKWDFFKIYILIGYLHRCARDTAGLMRERRACSKSVDSDLTWFPALLLSPLKCQVHKIRWSRHESTYIYYILESQRLEFPFGAEKAAGKPNITCWLEKTGKVTEPYLQLCKKQWDGPKQCFTGREGTFDTLMMLTAFSRAADAHVQQRAHPRGGCENSWLYTSRTLSSFKLWIRLIKL